MGKQSLSTRSDDTVRLKTRKRTGKLAVKLTIRVAIPLALLIIGAFVYTAHTMHESMMELKDHILIEESEAIGNSIDTYFTSYEGIVQSLMSDPELSALISEIQAAPLSSPEEVKELPHYSSAMDKLDAIAQSDRDGIDLTYLIDTEQCWLIYNGDTVEAFPTVLERDYYTKSKSTGGIVMCDPYQSSVGNTLVVPMAAPIYDTSNRMVGLTALDFSLAALDNILSQYDSRDGDFFIVLSENGDVIHNSYLGDFDPENIWNSGLSQELLNMLGSKASNILDLTFPDGQLVHCTTNVVGDWDWYVITGMSNSLYMQEAYAQDYRLMATFSAILLLVLTLTLFICNFSIVKPVHKLAGAANEMANGNLDIQINVKENNEIGQLGDALQESIYQIKNYGSYINEIATVLNQISNGNLAFTLQQDYNGEFAKVKTALENTARLLNDSLSAIQTAAEQVDAGSDQVAQGAQALSQGATEQASSTQELAATVNDINAALVAANQAAVQASHKADDAGQVAQECNEHMHGLVAAMKDISNTSSQINQIIKEIDDIAFQTNILALNAAVEAARAGAAGKGFAVVADEVRNLATKSAESAKNTATLVEASLAAVARGSALVNNTAERLQVVSDNSAEMATMVQEIAATAQRSSDSVQQVSVGLDQIASVVQTNSATAEESAAASEELSSQANVMKGLVGKFQLLNHNIISRAEPSPYSAPDSSFSAPSYSEKY